jgi:hypothetical protein
MPLTPDERASIIALAIERKFGNLLDWKRPELVHEFGANNLDTVEQFEKKLSETRCEVMVALEYISDDSLNNFYSMSSDGSRISESDVEAISADKISQLHRFVLPPIAYGFGHPTLAAKFDHWARMPRLTLHEVSLLTLGADPRCMKDDKFAELKKTQGKGKSLWAAHASFLEQREIFSRCFHHTGFGYASEGIARIKHWIDDLDIQVHPLFYEGLEARVAQKQVEVVATNATAPEQSLNRASDQETETLLKLIAAMAIKGYMFKLEAKRNPATADIQSDLDQLGISLDQKTILKWVRIACDVVPKD